MFGKQRSVNSVRHRCAQYFPVPPQAACRHATKCELPGEKFTQWNPMTERLEYLHIQQSMLDVFTRKWAIASTSKVVGKSRREHGEHENGEQKQGEQENGGQNKIGEQENGQRKIGEQENGQQKKGKQENGQGKPGEQDNGLHEKVEQACVTKWSGTCSV